MQQYDRHNPIIKWYQYDARKLYQTAEAEEVVKEEPAASAAGTGDPAMDDEVARIMAQFADAKQNSVDDVFAAMAAEADNGSQDTAAGTGDPAMDDEVARIMAQFADAKQNSVDDVFAMMAAEGSGTDTTPSGDSEDQDALLASLLKPKQNTVDDLVAKAREGK